MSHNNRSQLLNRRRLSKDVVAAMTALISLVAALVVLGIVTLLDLPSDAVIVTCILLLPLFVFLAVSGRISELQAPGGWMAKFEKVPREI